MTAATANPVAIILAAGRGSRLGSDKPFVHVGELPLIERTLFIYKRATLVQDIIVVVGAGRAPDYAAYRRANVHITENPEVDGTMISSIRAGLASTWAQERNFLITPVDVPFVEPELVDRLIRTFSMRDVDIVLPTFKGLGGHPGMFRASLRDDFFLHGDTAGAREVLLRHRQRTLRAAVPDPDICFDIDTLDDLDISLDPGARWAHVERLAERKRRGA